MRAPFVLLLLLVAPRMLNGFVALAPPRPLRARYSSGRGVCMQAQAHSALLTKPFRELCELLGERDARSAWNSYRVGRDPSAEDEEDAAVASHKLLVSPKGREILKRGAPLLQLAEKEGVLVSSDGTCKLLFRLADGLAVETVLIPPLAPGAGAGRSSRAKTSLCVSSQVSTPVFHKRRRRERRRERRKRRKWGRIRRRIVWERVVGDDALLKIESAVWN